MGILYAVHELDPARVRSLVGEFTKTPDLAAARAQELLQAFGKGTPEEADLEDWNELEDCLDDQGWNYLLRTAASVRSWDLDKSLDRPHQGLPGLIDSVPEMAPLKQLLKEAQGFAVPGIPAEFHPCESGLMGIATPATLRAAVPVAQRYSGPAARSTIGSLKLPFLQRLFGGSGFLRSWNSDDYLWTYWSMLMEATIQVDSRNHWFGIELS